MEAVDVGVGTDDDLVPPQSVHIEGGKVFVRLALYLYSAAQDFEQVGDDVALKNAVVVNLKAV